MAARLCRSPGLLFCWEGGDLVCVNAALGRQYRCSPEIFRLLEAAAAPMSVEELVNQVALPPSLIDHLVRLEMLLPEEEASSLADSMEFWTLPELATYRLGGLGAHRTDPFASAMPSDRLELVGRTIPLVPAPRASDLNFADVLVARRSSRQFALAPILMEELASLLIGAEGVQHEGSSPGTSFRPTPSGGARHPLEIFVLPLRVEGLAAYVHHFNPHGRYLVELADREVADSWLAQSLLNEAADGDGATSPAAVLVLMAAFARTQWKYERCGLAMTYRDTGALMQTLYLLTTALGLCGYAMGGGPQERVLGREQEDPLTLGYVGAFLVGHPAAKRKEPTDVTSLSDTSASLAKSRRR